MIEKDTTTTNEYEQPADYQTLRLIGSGEPTNYSLTVTGTLRTDRTLPKETNGNISGRNAEGTLHDETHGYRVEGDIVDLQIDGDATVTLDGVPVVFFTSEATDRTE